jgi:hypothetical protein
MTGLQYTGKQYLTGLWSKNFSLVYFAAFYFDSQYQR